MYSLDYTEAKTLQLTNDAFFYLYQGEELLDEGNMAEVEEVLSMFPNGFEVEESWAEVPQTDLIAAVFIPYTEECLNYDEYIELCKGYELQIKWLAPALIQVWKHNRRVGTRIECGPFEVRTNQWGNRYFEIPSANSRQPSIFFLKHFKKR